MTGAQWMGRAAQYASPGFRARVGLPPAAGGNGLFRYGPVAQHAAPRSSVTVRGFKTHGQSPSVAGYNRSYISRSRNARRQSFVTVRGFKTHGQSPSVAG